MHFVLRTNGQKTCLESERNKIKIDEWDVICGNYDKGSVKRKIITIFIISEGEAKFPIDINKNTSI